MTTAAGTVRGMSPRVRGTLVLVVVQCCDGESLHVTARLAAGGSAAYQRLLYLLDESAYVVGGQRIAEVHDEIGNTQRGLVRESFE